jgi:enoyl-CoA hydratase/carnithine racemase
MGGGLEIALHCDYRTMSTGAQVVAFPEVFLSIFPAWGGTQLAPRIVGATNAIETIVINSLNNNKVMSPKEAFERGYADRFIDSATFLDDSVAFLERLIAARRRSSATSTRPRARRGPRQRPRWPTARPTARPGRRTSRST